MHRTTTCRRFNTPGVTSSDLVGSPRTKARRFGDGCVADQEHPDRSGRRHQDRRDAGPRVTPRTSSRPRLPSPSFFMMGGTPGQFGPSNSCWRRCDHGRCLYTAGWLWCLRPRGRWFDPSDGSLWCSWCVQPQLGSVLVDELVRRCGLGAVRRCGQGEVLRRCSCAQPSYYLQAATRTSDVGQIGAVTRWTPVKNLTFSAEALYFMLHQNIQGSAVFTPG